MFKTQSIRPAHPTDLVITRNPPRLGFRFLPLYNEGEEQDTLLKIGQQVDPQQAHGEFIGLGRFSRTGAQLLRERYTESLTRYGKKPFHEAQNIRKAAFTDMIQELIERGQPVGSVNIYKGWMEVDTFEDYQKAWTHIKR
jgi:phosphoenolpyruvate phosphomutase